MTSKARQLRLSPRRRPGSIVLCRTVPSDELVASMTLESTRSIEAAGDEAGIGEAGFAIGEINAVEGAHAAAGGGEHGMTGRGIPLHGAAMARIEVGRTARQHAKFERAACRDHTSASLRGDEGVGLGIAMEAAGEDDGPVVAGARARSGPSRRPSLPMNQATPPAAT